MFFHDGRWSSFRGRDVGRPVDRSAHRAIQFLGYLQTHDQVGNRACGDRIPRRSPRGQQAIGAAIYLTSGFTPMMFMGEEWAAGTPWAFFSSFEEPELAEAVRNGRRAEFAAHGWRREDVPDPQDPATRDRSVLDWSELAEPDHERMCAGTPRSSPSGGGTPTSPTTGSTRSPSRPDDADAWLVLSHGRVRVVANLAAEPATCRSRIWSASADVVLAWDPAGTSHTEGSVTLPGHSVVLLRLAS